MAKTRQQKEEAVTQIADKLRGAKGASFSQVSGFTMSQADQLRADGKERGVEVFIAKKTLLGLAAAEAGIEDLDPRSFEGSILTAVSRDDEVASARLIKDFNKENESLTLIAGVLEGKGIGAEQVAHLASLPSKEELLAKMVGSLNAPVSGFVNVLAGNLRGLVGVLNAIKEQKA
jgi:large subunit ribosomal protein L10